ncbi:TPA: hypothetical protein ACXJLS_000351 [Stenotrophomonas maltophilia]
MDVEQRELPPLPMHRGYLFLHNTSGISQVSGYTEKQMTEYALTAIAALTPPEGDMGNPISVPDGFVLVPVEPTEAMKRAFNGYRPVCRASFSCRYEEMLAARPEVTP